MLSSSWAVLSIYKSRLKLPLPRNFHETDVGSERGTMFVIGREAQEDMSFTGCRNPIGPHPRAVCHGLLQVRRGEENAFRQIRVTR